MLMWGFSSCLVVLRGTRGLAKFGNFTLIKVGYINIYRCSEVIARKLKDRRLMCLIPTTLGRRVVI